MVGSVNAAFMSSLKEYQLWIEGVLPDGYLGDEKAVDLTMEAALYSLTAGGKRIRPVLLVSVGELLGVPRLELLPYACAIEMIHTYSLIHDDLPCMDNDDLRRGNPTCHKKYSEAIALLAGDSLLNRAMELVLSACVNGKKVSSEAALYLAQASGNAGMIGGQTMDMLSEGKQLTAEDIYSLHGRKTGALLRASIMIPVILSGKRELADSFLLFSRHLGMAFQIKDDLLDVQSTTEQLGKTVGKDAKSQKSTYVTLYGADRAARMLEEETRAAYTALLDLSGKGLDTQFLVELNQYLLSRGN